MKYIAKVRFLGTRFSGFQVQPDKRTVQGVLCDSLSATFGVPTRVTGCSRTDSGVHANEFCILIENDGGTIPADKLPLASAKFLPEDISLISASECHDNFHPRYDALGKEYLYRVYNGSVMDPFLVDRAWFFPRLIDEDGIERMNKACELFLGKHDFSSFMSVGSDVNDTVRDVKYLTVEKHADIIDIRIMADGFLYNMVRIIVGTLIEVAVGRFTLDYVKQIIESCDRSLAGMTAPACGLYLNRVFY
jgi:tRNA pseudouridine38-40 synthase